MADNRNNVIMQAGIHHKIAPEHLQDNLKLISDETLVRLKSAIKEDGYYSKKMIHKKMNLELEYSILVREGKFYAIYKGKKQKRHLGNGTFGVVKLLQDLESGELHAIKIQHGGDYYSFIEELHLLNRVDQVVRAPSGQPITNARHSPSKSPKMPHRKSYSFVMPLAHGIGLYELCNYQYVPPILLIECVREVLLEVKALHAQNILHRDLKLENIKYDPMIGKAHLIDFGLAAEGSEIVIQHEDVVGTPKYMAPEIVQVIHDFFPGINKDNPRLGGIIEKMKEFKWINNNANKGRSASLYYSPKTDIYALGITFMELFGFIGLADKHFFYDDTTSLYKSKQYFNNKKDEQALLDLFMCLVKPKPEDRLSIDAAIARMDAIIAGLAEDTRRLKVTFLALSAHLNSADDLMAAHLGLLKPLRDVDQVYILEDEHTDAHLVLKLQQELEKKLRFIQGQLVSVGIVKQPDVKMSIQDLVENAIRHLKQQYPHRHYHFNQWLLERVMNQAVRNEPHENTSVSNAPQTLFAKQSNNQANNRQDDGDVTAVKGEKLITKTRKK